MPDLHFDVGPDGIPAVLREGTYTVLVRAACEGRRQALIKARGREVFFAEGDVQAPDSHWRSARTITPWDAENWCKQRKVHRPPELRRWLLARARVDPAGHDLARDPRRDCWGLDLPFQEPTQDDVDDDHLPELREGPPSSPRRDCPVYLRGEGKPVWVLGENLPPLEGGAYRAVAALVEAYGTPAGGLTRKELNRAAGLEDARAALRDLCERRPEWKAVLRFPATPGGWRSRGLRYRIVSPDPPTAGTPPPPPPPHQNPTNVG
jgi:hypothetical protein